MIRSIALFRFKPGTSTEQIATIDAAMKGLRLKGMRSWAMLPDLGFREGNMQYIVVADFDDEAAYREYDADPEHNRVRRELLAPIAERVERLQYRVEVDQGAR